MPAAKLTLDFDSRRFFTASGTQVSSMTGKRNSIRQYELTIQQNNAPISLPASTIITAALKKPADPAGELLFNDVATREGWGSGSRWFFILNLTGDQFGTPVLGTNVEFEVLIVIPEAHEQRIPSLTVPFKIEKNVLL